MATPAVRPPSTFDFNNASHSWRKFKDQFKIYLLASGKSKESDENKIALMLNFMGEEGIEIFQTFNIKIEEAEFADVEDRFEKHCVPKQNLSIESFQFRNICQREGQSIEHFLVMLKTQASKCQFKCSCNLEFKDRMILDQLIVGIGDRSLQTQLLREENLTLVKAVEICKIFESSKQNLTLIEQSNASISSKVDEIKKQCSNCGRIHEFRRCPAYGKTCSKCGKYNHFSNVCKSSMQANFSGRDRGYANNNRQFSNKRTSRLHDLGVQLPTGEPIENKEETTETKYAGMMSLEHRENADSWYEELKLGNCNQYFKFKLDTGAETNVISKHIFRQLNLINEIRPTKTILLTYGNFTIKPIGAINLICELKNGNKCNVEFIVTNENYQNILGLKTCISLNLIKRINELNKLPCNKNDMLSLNNDVFNGIGLLKDFVVTIRLKPDYIPVINCRKKFPISMHDKLKESLRIMEANKVISKVDYPTEWVNSLIVADKPNGDLRLCLDPRPLNKFILREHFTIPNRDEIITRLRNKAFFSVLDLKNGFWQYALDKKSSDLCTFMTPFGRYKFNVLPFGISSAPEVFQRKNFEIFGDLENVEVYFDDVIVSGKTLEEHDVAFNKVIEQARKHNLKFNPDKVQYRTQSVKFMGLVVSKNEISPQANHIEAIVKYPSPNNRNELLRFLGLVKYICKFLPNLSGITTHLRNLTSEKVTWHWNLNHENEFESIKSILSTKPVLKIFDPKKKCTIQCDASKDGLGCVLLQEECPVAFSSRSLNSSEKKYAQIEKEMLAIVFATEKFYEFIYGQVVEIQTDHKPLITIIEKKSMNDISARLQRMVMKLLKFDVIIKYNPGPYMYIADALSRAFLPHTIPEDPCKQINIHNLTAFVPMTSNTRNMFMRAYEMDETLICVKKFLVEGWPEKNSLNPDLKHYYKLKNDIYMENEFLFFLHKLIVPKSLRNLMLKYLHAAHSGIEKTRQRARQIVYWPQMSIDIEKIVSKCQPCQTHRTSNQKEPLISHPLPNRPWENISADIFELGMQSYIVLIDAYSNWIEVEEIKNKSVQSVIQICKLIFSRLGVPDRFMSDNVPFNSFEFKKFANEWNFDVVFSSPRYAQSNGLAEKGVFIAKRILSKLNYENDNQKWFEALLEYRNTPIPSLGFSPAQIMMSRMLKSKVPTSIRLLQPQIIKPSILNENIQKKREKQKYYYDNHAKARKNFQSNDNAMYKVGKKWQPCKIIEKVNERSYIIKNVYGQLLRRNKRFLNKSLVDYDQQIKITIDNDIINPNATYSSNNDRESNNNQVNNNYILNDNNNVTNDIVNQNLNNPSNNINIDRTDNTVTSNDNNDVVTRFGRISKQPPYLKDYQLNFD